MDTAAIRRYLDLKEQLAALQRQIDQLRPAILDQVREAGGRIRFEDYALISQVSRTWAFTAEVESLEKLLKLKRREEIASGKARLKTETHFVMIRRALARQARPRPGETRITDRAPKAVPYYVERARQSPPRAYEAWTEEEDVALTWQSRQGRTVEEMATAFQRQPGAIRSRLAKLGLIG